MGRKKRELYKKEIASNDISSYINSNITPTNNKIKAIRQYIQILFPTMAIMISFIVVNIIAMLCCVLKAYYTGIKQMDIESYTLIETILSVILMVIISFVFYRKSFYMRKNEELHLTKGLHFSLTDVMIFIGIAVILQLLPCTISNDYAGNYDFNQTLGVKTIICAMITTFISPVFEEIIYRHITYKYALRATNNKFISNIIQAVLFGIVHMNIMCLPIYIFGGYMLGIINEKYGITNSIFYHIVINLFSVIPVMLFIKNEFISLIILAIALFLIILLCIKSQYFKKTNM
jgi:membrane protease YdiL (CAAX protease family)